MTIEKEVNEYLAKSTRSRALHEEALAVMPGGNSRTTTFFDPYPFYVQRGQGAHVWDADGVDRLDFNGNYTSLILGHAPPDVVKAAQEAAALGMSFPGPTEHEVRLAEILTRRMPSMETLRFTNSGTEATMNAVRLARAFTGRPKIAKFEGAYHGTHDWVMVSVAPDPKAAGNRRRPKPVATSAGIPPAAVRHVVVLPWNDADACEEIIAKEAANLAAGGGVPRAAARRHRAPRDRADPGRGDLVSHRVGRRPGALRDPARPHHARQDHRRRPRHRRLRRPARHHGVLRSAARRRGS